MHEIETFFQAYRRTGEASESLAPYYHAPCLTLRADGSFVSLQSKADVESFFQSLADTYRGYRWTKFPFNNFSAVSLGARSVFASMAWEARKSDGSIGKAWGQSYNLVRFDGRWKIVLSTFHVDG
jgi:hypothetical protein